MSTTTPEQCVECGKSITGPSTTVYMDCGTVEVGPAHPECAGTTAPERFDDFALRVEDACGRANVCTASIRTYQHCVLKFGSKSPAALGCLLALVREAWGGARIEVSIYDGGAWLRIESSPGVCAFEVDANGLGQALIEALEAGQ